MPGRREAEEEEVEVAAARVASLLSNTLRAAGVAAPRSIGFLITVK